MKKGITKEQKNKTNKYYVNKIFFIPIVIIITIVPLITYAKIVALSFEEADFWKGGTTYIDFFSYYKSIAFLVLIFFSFIVWIGLYLDKKTPLKHEKKYYIPMAAYVVFVILSSIMSTNKHVAVVGFMEMYQGLFVLIGYMLTLFLLINFINNEYGLKVIIYSFVVVTVIQGILGLGQYFGYDFLQSSIGKTLITPQILDINKIGFVFGKNTIYGTLYNTNFVGSFASLVLPISVVLYLFENNKKLMIGYGMLATLAFSIWVGCNSRAGYIGIIVATLFGALIFRVVVKKCYKRLSVLILIFVFVATLFNISSDNRVLNQFAKLNPQSEIDKIKSINSVKFEEVSLDNNNLYFKTNRDSIIFTTDNLNVKITDGYGKDLHFTIDEEGSINFADTKYNNYKFRLLSDIPSIVESNLYGRALRFYINETGKLNIISMNNKLTEPIEAPRIKWFDGKETFASNRGYIWSRTIPLLKDTLIIGFGPDNFPIAFPQEDYVGRFNVGNTGLTDIIIDKPHNMYLQTAVNTGVFSLVSLMVIWILYLVDSLKIYIKGKMTTFVEYIGAAIFLSIVAYLVAGLFNDNIISVAPLFWVLLGTGISVNRTLQMEDDV